MRPALVAAAVLAVGGALGAGCARSRARPEAGLTGAQANREGSRGTSANVISAEELQREPRPLLDLLRFRFMNMEVRYTSSCPEIHLRGRSTLVSRSEPAIYVDGTRATNTCILTELNTVDLSAVEIYASGIPGRPGYRTHPDGVIIIFVRKGE